MKTHRSTQMFYCSGGGRSVKCVRPALAMEASKEEQREVWFVFWWLRMLEHAKFIVASLLFTANTVSSFSDVRPSRNLFCHSRKLVRDIQCSQYTADMRQ